MNTKFINPLRLIFILTILLIGGNAYAQDVVITKETFKVFGNCTMCKKTIENGVNTLDGIKSAKWGVDSKKMTVKFDAEKVSLVDIKKAIAGVGYDTEDYRAEDAVYKDLHGCCQYERPKK